MQPSGEEHTTPAPAPRSQLTRGRSAFFAFIATMLFFGLLEVALRFALPLAARATLPETMIRRHVIEGLYRYDPDVFWYHARRPLPGIGVNEFGFRRTRPMTLAKPAGVTRVFTFGDSQTWGAGVDADQSYSAFAEEALGPGWEVINAGLSGYRSLNVYRLIQLHVAQFEPDILVIDCFPFDSPRDNGPLAPRKTLTTAQRAQALLWNSAIYRALDLGIDKGRRLVRGDPSRLPSGIDGFQGNHDLIAAWARIRGIDVVFMEYAETDQGNGIRCRTQREYLPKGHPVVPTCERLKAAWSPERPMFQDKNHLNLEGNRVAGQALAETLRPLKR